MQIRTLDLSSAAAKDAAILDALRGRDLSIRTFAALHGLDETGPVQRIRTAFGRLMEDGTIVFARDAYGKVLRDDGPMYRLSPTVAVASLPVPTRQAPRRRRLVSDALRRSA